MRGSFRAEVLCAAACALLWTRRAPAEEADAHDRSVVLFKEGVTAGKAGDYARAEVAFRTSYALGPSASTLRNWALTEMRLGKMVEALGHFRVALQWSGWSAEQRKIVKQNFDDAYGATGHVAIRTTEGAQVAIDGVLADGVAPFDGPLDVAAGRRRFEARLGAEVERADVEAPPGQIVHVDLPVASPSQEIAGRVSASGSAPAVREDVGRAAPIAPSRTSTWWSVPHAAAVGLGAAGAVGLALGLAFDASSNAAASDAGTLRAGLAGRCTGSAVAPACTALHDKIGEVHTDETLAGIAFAAGGAAAVGGAVLLVIAGPGAVVRTGAVQWRPRIAPGAAGVAGSF